MLVALERSLRTKSSVHCVQSLTFTKCSSYISITKVQSTLRSTSSTANLAKVKEVLTTYSAAKGSFCVCFGAPQEVISLRNIWIKGEGTRTCRKRLISVKCASINVVEITAPLIHITTTKGTKFGSCSTFRCSECGL